MQDVNPTYLELLDGLDLSDAQKVELVIVLSGVVEQILDNEPSDGYNSLQIPLTVTTDRCSGRSGEKTKKKKGRASARRNNLHKSVKRQTGKGRGRAAVSGAEM